MSPTSLARYVPGEASFTSAETQLSLAVGHDGVVEFQKRGSLFALVAAKKCVPSHGKHHARSVLLRALPDSVLSRNRLSSVTASLRVLLQAHTGLHVCGASCRPVADAQVRGYAP